MKITFLSHTAMGGAFVVGSHHLAKALSRAGHEVTHVSAAVSAAHVPLALKDSFIRERIRRWARGGDQFEGVRDIVPFTFVPWAVTRVSPALIKSYSLYMLAAPFRSFRSLGLGNTDYLIVDDPRFAGVTLAFDGGTTVYRATDLYAAMRNDTRIIEAERLICAQAELLVATSDKVAEHLERIGNKPVHVIPNGVDFEHFATASRDKSNGHLELPGAARDRAVYVGAFDSRFGRAAVRAAARGLPDKRFILIGPGSNEAAAELGLANVSALGPMRYSMLPGILQQCAVGLLPMSNEASNEGRSPMKFYEYAAAGLCVAATSTHELRRRKLPTLFLGSGDVGFCAAVSQAFEKSTDLQLLQQSRAIASGESWQRKADDLIRLMRAPAATAA